MRRYSLSLKSRQILIFLAIITLVLPTLLFAIEQAFKQSQVKALEQQLEANLYALIGEIDLDAATIEISSAFLPPQLNLVDSGTIALIEENQQMIWRSDSALNQQLEINTNTIPAGQSSFSFDRHYWRYRFALFYDNSHGTHNLVLHVLQHESVLAAQIDQFRQIIIRWFVVVAFTLVAALGFGLWSTLAPIKRLDDQIKLVEKGLTVEIHGHFPIELTRVKQDLNLLIHAQERQKNRYRSYLSDLTHALKTPVAVMKSSPISQDPQVTEQLDRMTNIIEHQLRKASSGGEDVWKKQITVDPVVNKLVGVMAKIYADKAIQFHFTMAQDAVFHGDEADLMEILGNLIDNGCKACRQQLAITVEGDHSLIVVVEDDGPGIPATQREQLLIRGQRLDTYSAGHGVGMAIVNDLVNSYQAKLDIGDSALGGAKFTITFANRHGQDPTSALS